MMGANLLALVVTVALANETFEPVGLDLYDPSGTVLLATGASATNAARVIHGPRLLRWFDRTLDVLQARLQAEPEDVLARMG